MKVTTMLVSAMLVLGVAGVAHATNMFAGPLNATSGCTCVIVNVTTTTKTVFIQLLNKGGIEVTHLTAVLDAGEADGVSAATSSLNYCKFTNAAPVSFRAMIVCDSVAAPAR